LRELGLLESIAPEICTNPSILRFHEEVNGDRR
jgi:hypothetical protein